MPPLSTNRMKLGTFGPNKFILRCISKGQARQVGSVLVKLHTMNPYGEMWVGFH